MEGHERELEADAGNHECHSDDEHGAEAAGESEVDVLEVERAGEAVNKRESHHEDSRREYGCEDVLDGSFVALVAVFVEGDHCGEGQRGAFKTDNEEKEMTCRNHEVHAEESDKEQLVELATAHEHILAVGPADALDEHDNDTYIEDAFDCSDDGRCLIHAGKCYSVRGSAEAVAAEAGCGGEQGEHYRKYGEPFLSGLRHEGIVEEYQQENHQNGDFLLHC